MLVEPMSAQNGANKLCGPYGKGSAKESDQNIG